jgi:hypothetical protein
VNSRAVPVQCGAIRLGAAVWVSWRWDTNYHWDVALALVIVHSVRCQRAPVTAH